MKEELIGTVEGDKAREIGRELERQCRVGARACKEEVIVGRSEQNPYAIFNRGDRKDALYFLSLMPSRHTHHWSVFFTYELWVGNS